MSDSQPTGKELIGLSKEQGLISEKLYIMETFLGDGEIESVLKNLQDHLAYWDKIEQQDGMFAAGPFIPEDPSEKWSGDGLVIISASSYSEARKIAEEDPMHKSGARDYKLRPWLLNHMDTESA